MTDQKISDEIVVVEAQALRAAKSRQPETAEHFWGKLQDLKSEQLRRVETRLTELLPPLH